MITDHESLKQINTKMEQLVRLVRFLNAIEHYGIRIIYWASKANVLADYLSRPPETAHPANEISVKDPEKGEGDDNASEIEKIDRPERLNRIDLQAVYEYLHFGTELPPALDTNWVRDHFVDHQNALYKIAKYTRNPGDPPHPGGITLKSTMLLKVPEYEELYRHAKQIY